MSNSQPTQDVTVDRPEDPVVTPSLDYVAADQVARDAAAKQRPGLPPFSPIHSGALPPHYREVLYWKITQNRWQVILVNLISLPVAALMGLLFFGWAGSLNPMPGMLRLQLPQFVSVIVAIVGTLVLHEGVHGLAMLAYGARPRFGVLWQGLMIYATSPGYTFRRNDYLVVALAPLIGLSLLALIAMLFFPPVTAALVALCATVNGAGAVGDLWIVLKTLRYSPQAYIMDKRDGMRIFMPGA